MSEYFVTAVLLGLGLGQLKAVYRGMPAAVAYYICVAPLGYFSIWKFGRWDPDRLCGLILILGSSLIHARDADAPEFHKHPLGLLLLYIVFATLIMAPLWPVETMQVNSAIHGVLRPAISIANWVIVLGVAWKIGMVFRTPGVLTKYRSTILWTAVPLCLYGIYQSFAFNLGLPMTGMRRAAGGLTAEGGGEVYAAYALFGETVFRPFSFVGEPKSLGAACVFWLALLLSGMFERRWGATSLAVLAVIVYTIWLTASTGAWVGTLVCLGLFFFVSHRLLPLDLHEKMLLLCAAGLAGLGLIVVIDEAVANGAGESRWAAILEERFMRRLVSDESEMNEADNLEVVAVKVLRERPQIFVFGAGLGGITYYMSELIGDRETSRSADGSSLVLAPTIGLLAILCDIGLLGLILIYLSIRRGLAFLRSRAPLDRPAVVVAFVGTVTLVQNLIHAPPVFTGISIGLLIAAAFHTFPALSRFAHDREVA